MSHNLGTKVSNFCNTKSGKIKCRVKFTFYHICLRWLINKLYFLTNTFCQASIKIIKTWWFLCVLTNQTSCVTSCYEEMCIFTTNLRAKLSSDAWHLANFAKILFIQETLLQKKGY